MYQVIIANNIFSFIDGDYFDSIEDSISFINEKLIEYKDDEYKRIENVFVKGTINIEVRKMIGFQELVTDETENSYIILARYNRKKNKWDRAGTYYTKVNFIDYNIHNDSYFYLLAGNVLEKNLLSINNFKDPDALKEYITELFIYNNVDPKAIYDKMIICRNRRTIESVIKFCYDTILASNGLISI